MIANNIKPKNIGLEKNRKKNTVCNAFYASKL